MDYDIYKKGIRIITFGKIEPDGDTFFKIKGEEEPEYIVKLVNSKVSCTCRYFSIHGAANFRICSHIAACIFYKMKKQILEDNNGNRENQNRNDEN